MSIDIELSKFALVIQWLDINLRKICIVLL